MKLRYYMRGLGIGMVVTALIMGIATREALPLTDAEIKAKALTLGMVDQDSLRLSDVQWTPAPGQETEKVNDSIPPEDGSGREEDSGTEAETADGSEDHTDDSGTDSDSSASDSGSETDRPGAGAAQGADKISITIESGAGSYLICQQLEEAGLVEDAWEFDKYLIDNGLSKKVHAGTHEIPVGADWDEIIKIITKTGN